MNLSIIIPFYNDLAGVLTCVNSLQAFAQAPHQYIIQDDASPNVNANAVIPPCVAEVERNPVNMGFAGNVNAGAARATGDILFIVNQDVYGVNGLSVAWDAGLLAAFDNPQVGAVGARLLFPDGSIQSAGGVFDGHGQPTHRCLGYKNRDYKEIANASAVSWVTGAALAVRRDVFFAVGGMDTAYVGGYFEDVEICMRIRQAGYGVWYTPACTLIHRVGSTGGNKHFMQNARLFKQRWVDSGIVKPDMQAVKEGWW